MSIQKFIKFTEIQNLQFKIKIEYNFDEQSLMFHINQIVDCVKKDNAKILLYYKKYTKEEIDEIEHLNKLNDEERLYDYIVNVIKQKKFRSVFKPQKQELVLYIPFFHKKKFDTITLTIPKKDINEIYKDDNIYQDSCFYLSLDDVEYLYEIFSPLNDNNNNKLKKEKKIQEGIDENDNNYFYIGEYKKVNVKEDEKSENNKIKHGKKKIKYGRGIYVVPNLNIKYIGYFKNDLPDIYGKLIFDGGVYEGKYEKGERNGKGIVRFNDGEIYDGNWENSDKNGQGICIYPNGEKYDGNFINNLRSGEGTYNYADGSVYTGSWLNNNRHGMGILTNANGEKNQGNWENDELC